MRVERARRRRRGGRRWRRRWRVRGGAAPAAASGGSAASRSRRKSLTRLRRCAGVRDFAAAAVLRSGCWVLGSGTAVPVPALEPAILDALSRVRSPATRSASRAADRRRDQADRARATQMAIAVAAAVNGTSQRNRRAGVHAWRGRPRRSGALHRREHRHAARAVRRVQLRPRPRPARSAPPSAQAASVSASRQASAPLPATAGASLPSQPFCSRFVAHWFSLHIERSRHDFLRAAAYGVSPTVRPASRPDSSRRRLPSRTRNTAQSARRSIHASRRFCSTASRMPLRVRASCRDVVASCSFNSLPVLASVNCCA